MYRINDLIRSFLHLVGWEDTETISRSESGLYFQEAHPLLTLRAMRAIMPEGLDKKYPKYESGVAYAKGARVNDGSGNVYESLVNDNTSGLFSGDWRKHDILEDYLLKLTEGGIKKTIARVASEKIVGLESQNIVDRRTLFDGAGRREGANKNEGRLVGFEFEPLRANGVTTILNKVGLQFVGNVGTVKLYLFHSSQPRPIATKELEYTSERGGFMWFDLDEWVLPYVSESINAGGKWYVVYDEKALAPYMKSVNFGRDWSREPCGTCNKGDIALYQKMSRHLDISPFYVSLDEWDGELWDIESMQYTNTNNYGLNFMVTMCCDITEAMLMEKDLFAHAIQLQVAADALRSLVLNPEVSVNRVQFNAERDNIMFELEGNGQGIKGLNGELERAYKAISIDLKGMDNVCMACHNKGIKYGSI